MAFAVKGRPDTYGATNQGDIVDNTFPHENFKTVVWDDPKDCPGLTIDFADREKEESISTFIYNSLRTRTLPQVWELELSSNMKTTNTRWTGIIDDRKMYKRPLRDSCTEIARQILGTDNVVGIRITQQHGAQLAINPDGPADTKRSLTMVYKAL